MAKYQSLFEYDESVNDGLTVIMDYLRDNQPDQKITKAMALRYAVIVAAMSIQAERMKAGEPG